jgi:hypothetical protein
VFAACDSPTEELPPPTVALTAPTRTVAAGTPLQVSATVTEASGKASTRKITWESSDPAIAAVDASGRVTANESGPVTITASVGGTSDTLHVTAMRAPNPGGPQSTFLAFSSTPGDYIGQGQTVGYGLSSGSWNATTAAGRREVHIRYDGGGLNWWYLEFAAPQSQGLKVGTYQGAARWPFQPATSPGLSFSGNGRGCNTLTGRFVIHDIAIDHEGKLHRLHATFRQHCEGGASYLDGEVAILQQPLR